MGSDKALLTVGEIPLLQHVINAAQSLGDDRFIISNNPTAHASFTWPLFPDRFPETGPLGGLATALHHATTSHLLLLACDMPNLEPALLQYLADQAHLPHLAIVPDSKEGLQPLCAVYSKSALPLAEASIEQGQLSMRDFIRGINTRVVQETEWAPLSGGGRPFVNLNTPEEFAIRHKKTP